MPQWTKWRASKAVRRSDGTFKKWLGGLTKGQLKKKENNFHGIQTHIGIEFRRQHGRKAKVGDCVRFKRKDGGYHEQAFWYVRTPHGWRKATHKTKPSAATIQAIIKRSRKGRKA